MTAKTLLLTVLLATTVLSIETDCLKSATNLKEQMVRTLINIHASPTDFI